MKTGHWIVIALIVGCLGAFAGYKTAVLTGIEPQHFAAVESGGYGASESELESLGLEKQTQDYYKDLMKEEQ